MKTNKLTAEEMVIADRLKQMKMSGMAEAYEEQLLNPNSDLVSFQDRFSAIINFEWELRFNKKFNRFLKKATLRYPHASFDETIYEPDRMLDTETIELLSTCKWLDEGRNLLSPALQEQVNHIYQMHCVLPQSGSSKPSNTSGLIL